MNIGAILDKVAGEVDEKILEIMKTYSIPPSLMDKVLDRIQSHMRQMKSEEYAAELTDLQLQIATSETLRGSEADNKEKIDVKKGEESGEDIQQPKEG